MAGRKDLKIGTLVVWEDSYGLNYKTTYLKIAETKWLVHDQWPGGRSWLEIKTYPDDVTFGSSCKIFE